MRADNAKATGLDSHAEGKSASASAAAAHAEGLNTIASGSSSHAEGSGNTASGNYGSHAEGNSTSATSDSAHAEGSGSLASASSSHAEGNSTTASGANSHAEGSLTIASGASSHAQGDRSLASRLGQSAAASGFFAAVAGDAQWSRLVLMKTTTNATPAILTAGGDTVVLTGAGTSVLTVPVSRAHRFRIEAIARNTAADEFGAWTVTGTIVRYSSGSARFIGTPIVVTDLDAAAAAWTLAVSVDTVNATNNYLAITATGEAAKTIRWVATLYTTEVG